MNFKKISFLLGLPLLLVSTLLYAIPFKSGVADQLPTAREGVEYVATPKVIETAASKKGKIEVREFFWYGCGHCYQAFPVVEKWKETLADDVVFIETPALFSEQWAVLGRGLYISKALGIFHEVHPELFKYVQVEHKKVNTVDDLAEFFEARFDVPKEKFYKINDSKALQAVLKRDGQLIRDYMISSVPTFVVDGKYITSASKAGTHAQTLDVIDQLVDKIRKENAKK